MELSSEQIKKALECCIQFCDHGNMAVCKECPLKECRCSVEMPKNALALIKKLTEENEAWQKQSISYEEKAGKAYYDLACEVEDLRAENANLHASCTELAQECKKFAERLKKYYNALNGKTNSFLVAYHIDEVLKEMIGEAK